MLNLVGSKIPPKKISCGLYTSASVCNLRSDGSGYVVDDTHVFAHVWGRNKWNVLGIANDDGTKDGGQRDHHQPKVLDRRTTGHPPNQGIYEVSCGLNHTLFLMKGPADAGGTAYACGLGNRGRLGGPADAADEDEEEVQDIWFAPKPRPVTLKGVGANQVLRICCGADHSLCLTTSGQLYAWGLNEDGRCGVGSTIDVHEPTLVKTDRIVGHFAAGGRHSMFITGKGDNKDDEHGQLYAWGFGEHGRLGLGSYSNELVPKRVLVAGNVKFSFVACGEAHSGVIGERRLWMFGAGSHGRLGLGDCIDVPVPREVLTLAQSEVMQIALGGFHSLALTGRQRLLQSQRLFSWGVGDALGTLTEGDVSEVVVPRMVNVHENRDITAPIVQIAAGMYHSLLLLESGMLVAFGIGSSGRLGTGKPKNHCRPAPVKGYSGYAVDFFGQKAALRHASEKANIGEGTEPDKRLKEPWSLAQIRCGATHTCALTRSGDLYTCGSNDFGQLGLGVDSPPNQWHPKLVQIPGVKRINYIAAGYEHCLAISHVGELYTWGKGSRGQLGTTKTRHSWTPERVSILSNQGECLQCAAGDEHSAVIIRRFGEAGHALYTWGSCELGKLGFGDEATSDVIVPQEVQIPCARDETPTHVACGQDHTAVICGAIAEIGKGSPPAGSCWTFGSGWYGRLGHGDTLNQSAPKQVTKLETDMRFVACGAYHTVAIEAPLPDGGSPDSAAKEQDGGSSGLIAGNLWIWGKDSVCCEHEHALSPLCFQRIDNQPLILAAVCGVSHTIVVTEGLEVFAWGDNTYAQLGLGRHARKEVFVPDQIKTLPGNLEMYGGDVVMGTGLGHTVAFVHTKQTFAWGCQSCGRLGLEHAAQLRLVVAPLKVRAEWASVEAMGGVMAAEVESEESGDDEDGAASSASSKSAAKASKKSASKKGDEDEATARMVAAVKGGQQVQKFSTLQMLLKQEPEESKEHSLLRLEGELIRQLTQQTKAIYAVPEKEKAVMKLRADLANSLSQNLRYLKQSVLPEAMCATPRQFSAKLTNYEELVWILQQQAAYMSSLSMCLEASKELQDTFYRMVSCIYADLNNGRVLRLFITMLKLMINKEVEHAKRFDEVFQPNLSRAFYTFSWFALHQAYFKFVVHPIMDCTRRREGGPPPGHPDSVMAAIIDLTNNGQVFALTKEAFKAALQKKLTPDANKELSPAELTTEFHNCVDKLRDFLLSDFMGAVKSLQLHDDLNCVLLYGFREIKRRAFAELSATDRTVSMELKLCEPLALLFVKGILVPMLSNIDKYCSKQVNLGKCEKEAINDALTSHNISVIIAFLNELVGNAFRNEKEKKVLAATAKSVKLELLKFVTERIANVVDNTDTLLTIDAYASHFDPNPHYVQAKTSDLMKLSNMLIKFESKLKVSQVDSVERLCKQIGQWKPDDISAAEKDDWWHNLKMNTRFLLDERWGKAMTTCRLSQCPVPPMLSTLWGTELYNENDLCAIRTFVKIDRFSFLEELFRDAAPFQATTLVELSDEMKSLLEHAKASEDHTVTRRLHRGYQRVEELIRQEITESDLLKSMVEAITSRDSHRRYLEEVQKGMWMIRMSEETHAKMLKKAHGELRAALRASMKLQVAKRIAAASQESGVELKFTRISSHLEKVDHVSRQDLTDVSFAPQRTYTLTQLMQTNVVLASQGMLKRVKENDVQITFIVSETGVDVTISLKRGKIVSVLKKVRISPDMMDDIRRAKEGETVSLPEQEPVLVCMSINLVALVTQLMTGR
eukprot:TRINITY_DN12793_c0_g8_i1.p1 TRINITY_DN12793_c0_g8~~TRINITY_DN12793_c0_g8_i1.p1  ORF type:complete len:1764 (-),score=436.64 TRINITY_DN12793_c0_g8_i1:32-5323(-)